MSKPVVLIAEELSPATVEALGPDFEIRHCDGADRAALLPAIADVDAILVRSATKVDAEAIAKAAGAEFGEGTVAQGCTARDAAAFAAFAGRQYSADLIAAGNTA